MFSDEELAIIASAVKTGWGNLNSDRKFGRVYSANYYYPFIFNGNGSITVIGEFPIDADRIAIKIIDEVLDYDRSESSTVESAGDGIASLWDEQRRYDFDGGDGNGQSGVDGSPDTVAGLARGSFGVGYQESSGGDRKNNQVRFQRKGARATLTVNGVTLNSIGKPIYVIDVAMRSRRVWNFGIDRYHVENAGAGTEAFYPSVKAAMEAENESLIREYAKQSGNSVSYVKYKLDEDFEFLSNAMDEVVRRSRKTTGEVVTLSKGELAKLHANYAGDKVFNKGAVVEAEAAENGDVVLDGKGAVRYNKGSQNSPRTWASFLLSAEDWSLLEEAIYYIHTSNKMPTFLNGMYLVEVNNKFVVSNGVFKDYSVEAVIDVNVDNATALNEIWEVIRNAGAIEKGQSSYEFLKIVENLYREDVLMVYYKENFRSTRTFSEEWRPTRPYGYKDFGYSREQRYGGGSPQEAGRTVTTDSRLAPPSTVPVKHEYVDVTGNKRYVMAREGGQYSVYGTWSQRPYDLHPSIEAAIEAENNSLLRAYARQTEHTVTWIKRQLQDNPDFLKEWGKKRLLEKMPGGKVSRSRSTTGDVVTISKGELAKLHANYAGDKVFGKGAVVEAVKGIDALKRLPAATRNELVTRLWRGYNERLHQQGFEQFTEIMWHQIHAEILQESDFDMSEDEMHVMDEQIVDALHAIVASGKPSIKARLESDTSTEGYRKQAEFWRGEHERAVQSHKRLNSLKYELEKLAKQKMGLYINAANYRGDTFKVAIDELAKMNWRGGLVSAAKIRERFAALAAWYTKENPLYKGDGGTIFHQKEISQAREDKNANSSLAILLYTYFYTKAKFCIKKGIEKALKWTVSAFFYLFWGFLLTKSDFCYTLQMNPNLVSPKGTGFPQV